MPGRVAPPVPVRRQKQPRPTPGPEPKECMSKASRDKSGLEWSLHESNPDQRPQPVAFCQSVARFCHPDFGHVPTWVLELTSRAGGGLLKTEPMVFCARWP